ncbi:MAG: bifunctional folylpolyglutamate synthase/dihydrofolate synthase [Candidatus Dormibacteria bacterium]
MSVAPPNIRDYSGALEWLEGLSGLGMRLGLGRVRALLDELDRPEAGLTGVLVAGTNGKGSVCAMTESIVRAAGLRTGLLTKPHLESYLERIAIDGENISETAFASAIDQVARAAARLGEGPTQFEALTAAGFLALRDAGVDTVVCEVGLGGRLDSTNAVDLGVCAITRIALDHTYLLGDTIEAIAAEKAAIIKSGDVVIDGGGAESAPVVARRCAEVGATLELAGNWTVEVRSASLDGTVLDIASPDGDLNVSGARLDLLGSFQGENARTAVAAARAVLRRRGTELDEMTVRRGLRHARWRGRLEPFGAGPVVILDGGHNPDALEACLTEVARLLPGRSLQVVFGAMVDKDLAGMVECLRASEPAQVIFTRVPDEDRAAEPVGLSAMYAGASQAVEPPSLALKLAVDAAGPEGVVLVSGSLYLVGLLRREVEAISRA